jgi:hypothetical protein
MSSTEYPMKAQHAHVTVGHSQVFRDHIRRLFLCSALVVGGLFTGYLPVGWADNTGSYLGVSLQEGIMTGRGPTSIQIDHAEYRVHPKIVVKVAPGDDWSLDALPLGATVRFHVQEGQIDFLMYVPNN